MTGAPRDLPRRAAPVLFGLFNIAIGWTRAIDPNVRNPALSQVPWSLRVWGGIFAVAGVLILTGARWRPMVWVSASAATFVWLWWANLLWKARDLYPHLVPLTGPTSAIGIAVLHSLLVPYRRDHRRLDGRAR